MARRRATGAASRHLAVVPWGLQPRGSPIVSDPARARPRTGPTAGPSRSGPAASGSLPVAIVDVRRSHRAADRCPGTTRVAGKRPRFLAYFLSSISLLPRRWFRRGRRPDASRAMRPWTAWEAGGLITNASRRVSTAASSSGRAGSPGAGSCSRSESRFGPSRIEAKIHKRCLVNRFAGASVQSESRDAALAGDRLCEKPRISASWLPVCPSGSRSEASCQAC